MTHTIQLAVEEEVRRGLVSVRRPSPIGELWNESARKLFTAWRTLQHDFLVRARRYMCVQVVHELFRRIQHRELTTVFQSITSADRLNGNNFLLCCCCFGFDYIDWKNSFNYSIQQAKENRIECEKLNELSWKMHTNSVFYSSVCLFDLNLPQRRSLSVNEADDEIKTGRCHPFQPETFSFWCQLIKTTFI